MVSTELRLEVTEPVENVEQDERHHLGKRQRHHSMELVRKVFLEWKNSHSSRHSMQQVVAAVEVAVVVVVVAEGSRPDSSLLPMRPKLHLLLPLVRELMQKSCRLLL